MKTALGGAIIHKPKSILLDEPTNGLDVHTKRSLRHVLTSLRRDGHCLIFSSHVMEEISEVCDFVVMMANGTVVAHGTPYELCRRVGTASLEQAFVSLTDGAEC